MGKVRVHCYGCAAAVRVDDEWPAEGLRIAHWNVARGRTYCPSCTPVDSASRAASAHRVTAPPGGETSGVGMGAEDELAASPGPAAADRETAEALSRHHRRAWGWMTAASVVLAFTFALVSAQSNQARALLKSGVSTPGSVLAYASSRYGGDLLVRYSANGVTRQGAINLTALSPAYTRGDPIDVLYDPRAPARIRTPQEENRPRSATAVLAYGFAVGVALLIVAGRRFWQVRKWRVRLMRESWTPVVTTYTAGRRRWSRSGVELVPRDRPDARPVAVVLTGIARRREERLSQQALLWAAGDPRGEVILSVPRSREIFAARSSCSQVGPTWLELESGARLVGWAHVPAHAPLSRQHRAADGHRHGGRRHPSFLAACRALRARVLRPRLADRSPRPKLAGLARHRPPGRATRHPATCAPRGMATGRSRRRPRRGAGRPARLEAWRGGRRATRSPLR